MQSVLEAFARGNILSEPRSYKPDSHYGRAMEVLVGCEEKLLNVLGSQEKELLETLSECQLEINRLTGVDGFLYGYRLGVLMTMEVFNGKSDLIAAREGLVGKNIP